MSIQQQLNAKIQRMNQNLVTQFKIIQLDAQKRLKEIIWRNVYMRYSPVLYDRTYQLYNSVTLSPITISPTGLVEFSIYLDNKKMNHTSVYSGSQYWKGKKINVSYLVNDGHFHKKKYLPWFHQYPGANFIEDAIKIIEQDIRARVKDAISVEVKRMGKY